MAEFVLDPQQARRRQRRWQIALVLPTALVIVLAGYLLLRLIGGITDEVKQMGPWPGPQAEPAALIPPDLSALGLGQPDVVRARGSDSLWSIGDYSSGVVAVYDVDGQPALWVAALHFDTSQEAADEFHAYVGWAQENCSRYTYANLGSSGHIACTASEGYNKTLRQDTWIVDILATNAAPAPPRELVDDTVDAIAQHWKTLE